MKVDFAKNAWFEEILNCAEKISAARLLARTNN